MAARVLLADDHRMVVEGLRGILEPEFEIVGTVEDGHALVEAAKELRPDVVITDISMPLLNGIEAAEKLREEGCSAKVVFITMHPDVRLATRALRAGASGYVLKHAAPAELKTAVREALSGRTYVTPMIAGEVMQAFRSGADLNGDPLSRLSPRQREILQLLVEGRSAREIGDLLHISSRTVEGHKYRMMEELGISTNAELIQFAIQHGIPQIDIP
ncbi:MAG TPA: response regulator transcription factor [Armatimonadota bacterium]|nr:response regulator transcription factor [Armatimonadota bacterium]